MRLRWRASAEHQLKSQLGYIRNINPHAAIRMRERIKRRLSRLIHAPHTGRLSHLEGVRELVIAGTPYVAVYEVRGEFITILQFFHSSQDRQ